MSDEQFDARYRLEPHRAVDPGVRKRGRFVAEQQRELQAGLPRRPANIAYFEGLLESPPALGAPLVGIRAVVLPLVVLLLRHASRRAEVDPDRTSVAGVCPDQGPRTNIVGSLRINASSYVC